MIDWIALDADDTLWKNAEFYLEGRNKFLGILKKYGLGDSDINNFDEFEGTEFSGTTVVAGADVRIGIGERFEIGATGTVRANLDDNVTNFAYGPAIGFVPADGMLLTLGYNIEGFRDGDFSEARNTDSGVYAAVRFKFDTDTFGFLGLGRR